MKPPNYRLGTDAKHCGNCGAFKAGWCSMYSVPVSAAKVCSEWVPEKK